MKETYVKMRMQNVMNISKTLPRTIINFDKILYLTEKLMPFGKWFVLIKDGYRCAATKKTASLHKE